MKNIIEKLSENITLIERNDGFHCVIYIPMYDGFKTFLFTNDRNEAIQKAHREYEYLKKKFC